MTSSNEKPAITGYRQLSDEEIALINEIKEQGIQLDELLKKIESNADADKRWVRIAKDNLQLGLMSLTRAIAKPTSF